MKVFQMIILTVWMHFKSIQGMNDTIPNPCPVGLNIPVRDGNGLEFIESVVLRAMVYRGGCTCDILIENHIETTVIFIEKYKHKSAAAPDYKLCGLAINIEMLNDESIYNPNEGTNGVDRCSFSILENGVLRFTSRIIQGNFTRGYYENTNNLPQRLKVIFNESEIYQHGTSSINRTEIIPETTDSSDTMFISIGAGVGSLFIIIIVIIVILIRRQECKIKKPISTANLNMQYDTI